LTKSLNKNSPAGAGPLFTNKSKTKGMTLAILQREKIFLALFEYRKNYGGSQADFCKQMDINAASFSAAKTALANGKPLDKIISDDKLVRIGRLLNVNFSSAPTWNVVHTETFDYITASLEHCQENSTARIFCDVADIGKTTAAKQYMLNNQNVYYLDCSQHKSRTDFIRALAKVVGVRDSGSLKEVYRNTVYMLGAMSKPLIILDEAGDLSYPAFLEIKSYWNALDGACGWYMMGADGLAKKITTNVDSKKVGYAEILRRFGGEYMSVTGGKNPAEISQFRARQVQAVAHHNLTEGVDIKEVTKRTMSLTRVKENIRKAAKSAA
jgi:hypothetical protein